MTLASRATTTGKFIFSGTPDFDKENVFYGYRGTLFQTDENGNPTGRDRLCQGLLEL